MGILVSQKEATHTSHKFPLLFVLVFLFTLLVL